MAVLFFTCPNTRQRAPTGIETDVQSLRATWSERVKIHCSLCGGVHEMSVRETFVDSALLDATDRMRRVI
jgi:transcription elongation factor Elf1